MYLNQGDYIQLERTGALAKVTSIRRADEKSIGSLEIKMRVLKKGTGKLLPGSKGKWYTYQYTKLLKAERTGDDEEGYHYRYSWKWVRRKFKTDRILSLIWFSL